ncbi:MAG: hypothetical protein K6T65_14940 [Peptococcaceae bacterium]|nr:hypothetical protein [Peptococcaceae bacterium]
MNDRVASVRDELLAETAFIADGNRRIIAICRLAQTEKFRALDREILKRAVIAACIQATGKPGRNNAPAGGGVPGCTSGRGC